MVIVPRECARSQIGEAGRSLLACYYYLRPWRWLCGLMRLCELIVEDTPNALAGLSLFITGSYGFVLLLQLPQLSPASVLFTFLWVGVLVTLQPEAEPVHRAALRDQSFGGICQNMR